jgi:hypothetical protein
MADELTASAYLSLNKSGVTLPLSIPSATFDVSGTALIAGRPSIGFAAAEALAMGEVSAPGWAYMRNVSATNFVELTLTIHLEPGEWFVGPISTAAPEAQADTGAVVLDYAIFSR